MRYPNEKIWNNQESRIDPWPRYFRKSIAIHLPFLSRYFCKCAPSAWQKIVYTPPICITICLPFVSRYICRSIRVRGRWDTPKTSSSQPKLRYSARQWFQRSNVAGNKRKGWSCALLHKRAPMLGSVFGRTDFSRIFFFEPPDFFADFVAGFSLLIFVGKSAQKSPPGKSPAKSSKLYTTKIPDNFLQRGRANQWTAKQVLD